MKKEIRICGFGGQGVILSGFIIGKAACVFLDYHAVQSQSYGPEARGGAARSEIIISDEKIGYPRPTGVDIFLAMSQESFDSYRSDITDDTIIINLSERFVVDTAVLAGYFGIPIIFPSSTSTLMRLRAPSL